MNITFLGAAREVTGSCYLVETVDTRFLVDCGMVQGGREAPARNRKPFAFDPKSIDFVLLTHAHIDHSVLLPKLTRAGFQGPIYTTAATADLLQVMLPDSAHIQEGDADRAKRNNKSAHDRSAPPTPLYTMQDARDCLRQVRPIAYDQELTPHPVVRCRFRDAGHILGSAIIEAWVSETGQSTKLVFSGDLGQPGRPILRDPTPIDEADILVIESTSGDRAHKVMAASEGELIEIVERTLERGNVIVPAFAVGRTQEVLYHLHRLTREGRLSDLKVFVDSPMATEATRITRQHLEIFDAQAKALAGWHAAGKGQPYTRRVISLINKSAYADIIDPNQVDLLISPKQATIGALLRFVRQGDVVKVHSLRNGASEAIEAIAHGKPGTSAVVGIPINQIKIPSGVVMGALVRGEEVLQVHHDTIIEEGDHVIMFLLDKKLIGTVGQMFSKNGD